MKKKLNREGYWKSDKTSPLPMPVARERTWKGQRVFLEALREIEADAHEVKYRGFSRCRVCGKPNGSGEFRSDSWQWPSGYRHYVEEHNVRPSLAFQEHILGEQLGE